MGERECSIIDAAFDPWTLSTEAGVVHFVLVHSESGGLDVELWNVPPDVRDAAIVMGAVLREDYARRGSGTWADAWASARHAVRVHRPEALGRAGVERLVLELMIANGNRPSGATS